MMKYFSIQYSMDSLMAGKLPQTKEVIHFCNVESESNFIDKFPFRKIENSPVLSIASLYSQAKATDLIDSSGGIGFSFGSILISNKFKKIIDEHESFGIQFFSTKIIHGKQCLENYWQTHVFDIPYRYIDFENTDILLKDRDRNRKPIKKLLDRMSMMDFLNLVETMKYPKMIFLKNIVFKENMSLDFFHLRYAEGCGHGIVSNKLMNALKKENVTGVEFKPI